MLDNLKIMRYLQGLRVDGGAEGSSILHLFEVSYRRQSKLVLRYAESGRRQLAIYTCGRFLTRWRGGLSGADGEKQLY